jgi:hypothetical protein
VVIFLYIGWILPSKEPRHHPQKIHPNRPSHNQKIKRKQNPPKLNTKTTLEVLIFQNPHPRPKTQSAPTINNREKNQNQNRSMISSCPTKKETKIKRKLPIEIRRFESLHIYDSTKKKRDESTCIGFEE